MAASDDTVPVLLLKTKSTPGDAYEELFSEARGGAAFEPLFVPVLEHRLEEGGLRKVDRILRTGAIARAPGHAYGGFVFTSQRAVEAFAKLVHDGRSSPGHAEAAGWPGLADVPVYSVGPATTRALKAVSQRPPLQVFGGHTGNGESLAHFILEHYGEWYGGRPEKPPLLFLVGEQRRDIIPKTLMDETLQADRRIPVDETVVYGTGVMESFPDDFGRALAATQGRRMRWVVVFSPTGCDAMLRHLGLLDEATGRARPEAPGRTTFVATIGPTTRDHLVREFALEPDVCARTPSPEGVLSGIAEFIASRTAL